MNRKSNARSVRLPNGWKKSVQQGLKDARLAQISAQRRPHYPPIERMAILELRAARNWSLKQTAQAFLLYAVTITAWMKRLDDQGPDALVQAREPVNKFPTLSAMSSGASRLSVPRLASGRLAKRSPGPDSTWRPRPSAESSSTNPNFRFLRKSLTLPNRSPAV